MVNGVDACGKCVTSCSNGVCRNDACLKVECNNCLKACHQGSDKCNCEKCAQLCNECAHDCKKCAKGSCC